MGEWERVAAIVRSPVHGRTWIAHIADTSAADVVAGPLRIVKRHVADQVGDPGEVFRWKRFGPDLWEFQWRVSGRGWG